MSVKGLPFKRQVDEFLEKKPSVFKDNMVYISMSKIWNMFYTASDASCQISMERASREFHEKYYVQFTWIWQITWHSIVCELHIPIVKVANRYWAAVYLIISNSGREKKKILCVILLNLFFVLCHVFVGVSCFNLFLFFKMGR